MYCSELSNIFHQTQLWLDRIHGFFIRHVNIWYNSRSSVKNFTERRITEFQTQFHNEDIYMQNLHPCLGIHIKLFYFSEKQVTLDLISSHSFWYWAVSDMPWKDVLRFYSAIHCFHWEQFTTIFLNNFLQSEYLTNLVLKPHHFYMIVYWKHELSFQSLCNSNTYSIGKLWSFIP